MQTVTPKEKRMEQIRGVNLGNWLVLEKWMDEPISWIVYVTAPSTGKAEDKEDL